MATKILIKVANWLSSYLKRNLLEKYEQWYYLPFAILLLDTNVQISKCLMGASEWKIKVYTFLVKNFYFLQSPRKHDDQYLSKFRIQIADLKQLPGLKETKMAMHSITLKLNSTLRRIGLAMANKMTAKLVGKN